MAEEASVDNKFKRNRHRKKKFIANAKGFGRKGNYGHGTQLEQEEWNYFINILEAAQQEFESIDEKVMMANNVYQQTIDSEVKLSTNQVASRTLEILLPFVDEGSFQRFHTAFSSDLRPICSDRFASHILQKLIEISFIRSVKPMQESQLETVQNNKRARTNIICAKEYNLITDVSQDHQSACSQFVLKVSKYMLNNLEEFINDSYANHIIRTCILSLSGIYMNKGSEGFGLQNERSSVVQEKQTPLIVPEEWKTLVKEFSERLEMWPQFPEFPYSELTSGLLQSLCTALRCTDKTVLKHFGKVILTKGMNLPVSTENQDDIKEEAKDELNEKSSFKLKVFTTESSIRLLETLLQLAGPKLFTHIYLQLFAGRLIELSTMKSANFAVQKLLDFCQEKSEFELIYDELAPAMEDVLCTGHTGVVASLVQGCVRLQTRQGAFITQLQKALHCNDDKEKSDKFLMLVLKLKPYEIALNDKSNFIHLHGSLIMQSLLKFNKPIKIVQTLLDTDPRELIEILCNPKGSHVADAFLQSKFVGGKSREHLLRHLEGCYMDLAISRNGSHVLEAIYEHAGDGHKEKIVRELAEKVNQLKGYPSGKLINYKLRVDMYKSSPNQWKSTVLKNNNTNK